MVRISEDPKGMGIRKREKESRGWMETKTKTTT